MHETEHIELPRVVEGSEAPGRWGQLGDALRLILAMASIPAAFLLPVIGGVFALLAFLWITFGSPAHGRSWTPVVLSGFGLLLSMVMLAVQLPFSASHISPSLTPVDIPVTPA